MNITKKEIKEQVCFNIKQFIKFGIVGVSNTLISLIIYYVLIYFNINYIIANTVGFLVSVLNSFYWNNKYVFLDRKGNLFKAIIKCYLSYGIVFLLSTLLLYIMVNVLQISEIIAPILNLFVTIPINFILNKLWTFK